MLPIMERELIQGSPEWLAARCGSLGASQVALALAKTKTGWGASRENIRAQLVAERLTGIPCETYSNAAMVWGIEHEEEAVAAYEFRTDLATECCGLFRHPSIAYTHASPDRLVGTDGLVECKCPLTAQHIDTLLTETIDSKYVTQMQWQMCVTGRQWCDFVSFDPRMPAHMRLFVKRVHRDDVRIAELEKEVALFLREVATCYQALTIKFDSQRAA